ncbi:MAG: SAM-dependent methyltransferase, partial [Steroidobacteraceae bacterium]
GGEELEVLQQHGIPAVVVPGITAGLGAAASAAIPLTHRGVAQSVTFVTATGAAGEHLNWLALAAQHQTVVFYMSAAQISHIVARLLESGAHPDLPATIIERATWPDQRVIKSTLALLTVTAQDARLQSPSLLVVGEVAGLAQSFELGAEFAA